MEVRESIGCSLVMLHSLEREELTGGAENKVLNAEANSDKGGGKDKKQPIALDLRASWRGSQKP